MQSLLTLTTEAIAIIGISGIILHAFWKSNQTRNKRMMMIEPTSQETLKKEIELEIEKPKPEPKEEIIIPVNPSAIIPRDFSKMTVKQLTEICKENKEKYKGYTTHQKKGKQSLIDWMQTR